MFVDLEHFDFNLKAGSPALELGFEQIPFERMGLLGKPTFERMRESGTTFSQLLTK